MLKSAIAALSCLYRADSPDLTQSADTHTLKDSLVKSCTTKPMADRSKVMPVQPFHDLFEKWDNHNVLPIKQLRLKTITLFALTLMLRPSDITPKSLQFDG